jgi:signal transduction histidine kinase
MKAGDDMRILIVDDTLENIRVLDGILHREGYSVSVATSGEQALKILGRVLPDLVLLDVMMPGLDGYETCRRLKADPRTSGVPVIFLTARVEAESIVAGFEAGGVDYLTKPFNATELLVRVRTQVSLHRLQADLRRNLEDVDRMNREQEAFLRHELNNRITPIRGYAEMLSQSTHLDEREKRYAAWLHEGAEELAVLLDDLRKLQDMEMGRVSLRTGPIDLGDMMRRVVDEQVAAFGGQVAVTCRVEDGLPAIDGDGILLLGVFQNLLKNAIEHVKGSGEPGGAVGVTAAADGEGVQVRVQNGGTPIAPERLARFFEKFNTEAKRGGTGLGTTYARLVTEAHGGTIGVTSDAETGTTVTVRLPRTG